MKLFIKILSFLKPYWKLVVLSILLTFFYVVFNNLSLWVSADFIGEIFSREAVDSARQTTGVDSTVATQVERTDGLSQMLNLQQEADLYRKVKYAIKRVFIKENRFDTLKMVCLIIFLTFLFKNVIFYYRRVLINFIELKIVISIRNKLQEVLLRLPLSYFEKHHTGKLTSIIFNDVQAVNTVLNDSFGKILLTPIQILANLVILISISLKLSLITFLIIPVSGYLIIKIGQSIRRKSRRVFQQISNVVFAFQEAVTSIRIVKAFTSEDTELAKFQSANQRYFNAQFRRNKLSFVTAPLNEILGVLILSMLLWYGGNLVYRGSGLLAEDFIRYLLFLFTMFQPMRDLSGVNNRIQTGLAAAERIFDILDSRQEVYEKPGAVSLDRFEDKITVNHVCFRYDGDEPVVLNDINLRIQKGQTVAFVGPSGSGKSTLVGLIPRFYDVLDGDIRIDGIDIRDYTLHSLRKQMGIVTQETILFNDTVRSNIAYGLTECTTEDIEAAVRAANAWDFIEKMENGLETVIGEKGIKLSGGERQRLSIARAILRNPPILILDEATSSLDTESERLVQGAIEKLMKNRTVLVIAHRLSTVVHSNVIVVLNRGEIVASGSHRKLLKSCALYRKLYEMQFRDEEVENNSSVGQGG